MAADVRNDKAFFCETPPFTKRDKSEDTCSKAAGRRYEKKALAYLAGWARSFRYTPTPTRWVRYRDHVGVWRYCEFDFAALSDHDDNLIIVEVKVTHTRDAFSQLALYKRVLGEIYPDRVISTIELCRYYDATEKKVELLPEVRPHNYPHAAVIWTPPRKYEIHLN